ncbi:MAG: SpoIID/LytB domain-containing protein [Dysgonamonadaceae bacterium]|jgi:SpoIID/LytB domain protein|nr:SpoIID/LytB domain-containing protein [Dysgonamonadaceae bacterium]
MNIPTIEVGIMSAKSIEFQLNGCFRQISGEEMENVSGKAIVTGDSSFVLHLGDKQQKIDDFVLLEPLDEEQANFELYHVVIGVKFHWERKETQRFKGKLKIHVENGMLTAVNILSLEDYLLSVISSEMSAASSLELLKAHAVISRSWLLAQIEKGKQLKDANYKTLIRNEEGYIRWYDREDHSRFDVCADDHCQRYQGITKVSSPQVYEALKATSGEVLMYDNAICDARFYKCCGGITEKFENVWEPVVHPYLTKVIDNEVTRDNVTSDLTIEENARAWILGNPSAFCNTRDKEVLSQVLNDYDQETQDFYRWKVTLTQVEIKDLLFRKIGIDVGDVLDLIPMERGVSGRIIRLKIVGNKDTIVIGKELEIRKALSESHLYSSAFVVEKVYDTCHCGLDPQSPPSKFLLSGAGWGHGVGLCQIGAAIMGAKGYPYREILTHYFPHAELKKIYT